MSPTVSVVIPSYQGATRLPKLLAALSAQQSEHDFEVMLVLDGSSDDSADVARGFARSLNLTVLNRGFNAGRSTTLNDGFEAASGDILIRCDDDLVPSERYVARVASWFKQDPEVGVVGICRNDFPATPYAAKYGTYADERFRREAYAALPKDAWRYWGGNCAVHRTMWEEVGPYDAVTFRAYGWEDIDWGYRLHKAGVPIILDPELETTHRVAATTCGSRTDRAELSGAAARLFDAKHGTLSLAEVSGAWGAAVSATAALVPVRWHSAADRALPHMSQGASRKLVDLLVQSSFRRGYLSS